MTRKKYVASLESRTTEQIAEEEALYIEIKRLEQNERRFKRERDELLRTLLGVDSGLPEIIGMVDDEGPMGGSTENGGKRRRRFADERRLYCADHLLQSQLNSVRSSLALAELPRAGRAMQQASRRTERLFPQKRTSWR